MGKLIMKRFRTPGVSRAMRRRGPYGQPVDDLVRDDLQVKEGDQGRFCSSACNPTGPQGRNVSRCAVDGEATSEFICLKNLLLVLQPPGKPQPRNPSFALRVKLDLAGDPWYWVARQHP